ncbi:N2227-like protein-domain-containing protein [Tribonema minus]|uniref:carnosine N-methyltransferase n=1 Tax=Tribonema minus TaxID=303371 RepID=A0A836CJL1_9STRA|nr:N2227-like protein-domain-containing protein [Tribonema minus]
MEVRDSFVHYIDMEMPAHDRAMRHKERLPADLQARLPHFTDIRLEQMQRGIELNQLFLDEVVGTVDEHPLFPIPDQMQDLETWRAKSAIRRAREGARAAPPVLPHNASKTRSTLHQLVRDWSAEGADERAQCYAPILAELKARLPITDENVNQLSVLVPGAGLGRLTLEIAALGYATEGNEFSYQMLFMSNHMLNWRGGPPASICPYVDNPCNHVGVADMAPTWGKTALASSVDAYVDNPRNHVGVTDMSGEILVPDINPAELLDPVRTRLPPGQHPKFSMTAGEWLEIYASQKEQWDCIVTCFFLDTAPVVMEYIAAIHRLLAPGGVWINLGPLQYHWANASGDDERFSASVELSWEEVRHIIGTYGFEINKEEMREATYNCNPRSMLRNVFRTIFFVATKFKLKPA